jgi:MFS family permease
MISDFRGRKGVLVFGMLLLSVTSLLYTVATDAYQLLPIRLLHGIVITSTFFIGMAYAGDRVAKADRGLVSGVYTTCMGLGFAIGSALGGEMATRMGYNATFRVAGLLALVGFGIAWWGLSKPVEQPREVRTVSPLGRLGMLAREPQLLAASLGYLLIILMFDAAIVNFFPLYAETLLIGQAAVGSMFAIRALASTSVRLPTGVSSTRFQSKHLMTVALVLGMVMVWSICFLTSPLALTIVLAGEGICFGMFLTSGQMFVTEEVDEADRGAAMGVYSTTGSIASTAGPFLMGAVAALWGLRSVFWFTGALVAMGIVAFLYLSSRPSASR